MLIGILSDTHDKVHMAASAIEKLQQRGAAFFIHCGDLCSEPVVDLLAGLPGGFVFGNCDWDRANLRRYAESIQVNCWGILAQLELDGKQIAVTHGDDHRLKQRILQEQKHDYLLMGHTHVRLDERIGRTRVINPGALHRAAIKTCALLDTASDTLEFLDIGTSVEDMPVMSDGIDNTPIVVRSFRIEDLPCCRKLFVEGLIGGKIAENDTGTDIDDIESAYMNCPGCHFWVAEFGEVVGMIGVQQHEEGVGEIRRLRVRQDVRRRGIGSRLMEAALKFCNEQAYLKITLDTFMEREPAIRLFEKFRFRHSRTRSVGGKDLSYFYLDLYGTDAQPPQKRL